MKSMIDFETMRRITMLVSAPILATLVMSAPCRADWVNNMAAPMPLDAVVGGHDSSGNSLYLCRAHDQTVSNDTSPGWTYAGDQVCHFSYGGGILTSSNFEWWTPTWTQATGQAMPVNAIQTGWEMPPPPAEPALVLSQPRYPCRVSAGAGISLGTTPGKYGLDLGLCLYPFGNAEVQSWSGFYWLVDPGNNATPYGLGAFGSLQPGAMVGPYVITQIDDGSIPSDAIVAGLDIDGQPLYACSAYWVDGMAPGKTKRGWSACDVSWGSGEHYVPEHYWLLQPNWTSEYGGDFSCLQLDCTRKTIPLVVGTDSNGATLFACQAQWPQPGQPSATPPAVVPGKIAVGFGGCSIAIDGAEQYAAQYNVLIDGVVPPPPVQIR
jgi:hypothetical protein